MNNLKLKILYTGKLFMVAVILLAFNDFSHAQQTPLNELLERALNAGIEQSQIDEITNRAESRGIPETQVASLLEPAVQLAEQNLPSDQIFQKALEGMAKNIPAQQISPVLNNIRQSTEAIVPVVDSWVGRPEVESMIRDRGGQFERETFRNEMMKVSSKAVSQQVGPELVEDILNTMSEQGVLQNSRPASVIAAIGVIADIPGFAERPEHAKGMVVRAVGGGFTPSDLQKLPGAMNMAQRRSQLPAAAVVEGVFQQMDGGIPASQILQNLFNGNVGGGPPGNIPPGLENRPGQGRN